MAAFESAFAGCTDQHRHSHVFSRDDLVQVHLRISRRGECTRGRIVSKSVELERVVQRSPPFCTGTIKAYTRYTPTFPRLFRPPEFGRSGGCGDEAVPTLQSQRHASPFRPPSDSVIECTSGRFEKGNKRCTACCRAARRWAPAMLRAEFAPRSRAERSSKASDTDRHVARALTGAHEARVRRTATRANPAAPTSPMPQTLRIRPRQGRARRAGRARVFGERLRQLRKTSLQRRNDRN